MFQAMLAINFNDFDGSVHFTVYTDDAEGCRRRDTFVRKSQGCSVFQTSRRFRTEREAEDFVLKAVRDTFAQVHAAETGRGH